MSGPNHSVYPTLFGVEEELQLERQNAEGGTLQIDQTELREALRMYKQSAAGQDPRLKYAVHDGPAQGSYNSAGARTYIDCLNAEYSTAEYRTIRGAIAGNRGTELFAAGLARHLLDADSQAQIIHRRRVGLFNDIIGLQDNLYIPAPPRTDALVHGYRIGRVLSAQAVMRPFMTGAGHYKQGRLHFSQKFACIDHGSWPARGFAAEPVLPRGDRFEVRENDINISDAAARLRLGSSAIAAAVAQTPLLEAFEDYIDEAMLGQHMFGWYRRYNIPQMEPDGSFSRKDNWDLLLAIDFQRHLATSFASAQMAKYAGQQPPELLEIAEQMYDYATQAKRVFSNDLPISSLANSDWAAKHVYGASGTADYDTTFFERDNKGNVVARKTGVGFMLRDAGFFSGTVPQSEVDHAHIHPPSDTRAAVRGALIRDYDVCHSDWAHIEARSNDSGSVEPVRINLTDPLQAALTSEQIAALACAQLRSDVTKNQSLGGAHVAPQHAQDTSARILYKINDTMQAE